MTEGTKKREIRCPDCNTLNLMLQENGLPDIKDRKFRLTGEGKGDNVIWHLTCKRCGKEMTIDPGAYK